MWPVVKQFLSRCLQILGLENFEILSEELFAWD